MQFEIEQPGTTEHQFGDGNARQHPSADAHGSPQGVGAAGRGMEFNGVRLGGSLALPRGSLRLLKTEHWKLGTDVWLGGSLALPRGRLHALITDH